MTKYIILGGCLGGVVLIIAIIVIACCCCDCRRKQNKPRQVKYILKPHLYNEPPKSANAQIQVCSANQQLKDH